MRRITSSLVPLRHVLALLALGLSTRPADAQTIKIGNLVDLTGPTSDQGKDIAQGRNDAVQYINEKGGVNGRKLELVSVEYGFQPPRAVAAYKKFVQDDKVLLVLGYGTPDTEALRPFITKDKVPYISGSYSGHLTDPKQTPYNFPGGIDYTQPDPHLPQLGEGRLEGHQPQAEGGLHLRRQRLRPGAHRGRPRLRQGDRRRSGGRGGHPDHAHRRDVAALDHEAEGPRLRLHQHQHPVGAGGAQGLSEARAEDQVRGQQLRHRRAHAGAGARGGRGRATASRTSPTGARTSPA